VEESRRRMGTRGKRMGKVKKNLCRLAGWPGWAGGGCGYLPNLGIDEWAGGGGRNDGWKEGAGHWQITNGRRIGKNHRPRRV
jgi:hypothetical protein